MSGGILRNLYHPLFSFGKIFCTGRQVYFYLFILKDPALFMGIVVFKLFFYPSCKLYILLWLKADFF